MKRKPYYETPLGKLYHGDCLEIMPQLEPVDLVLTDPPYRIISGQGGGLRNKRDWMKKVTAAGLDTFEPKRFMKRLKNPHAYIFCSKDLLDEYIHIFKEQDLQWEILIYAKKNPIPTKGNKYLPDKEYCFFIRGGGNCYFNNNEKYEKYYTVKLISVTTNKYHPTEKDPQFIQDRVLISTKEGSLVLDPFLGSGTTAMICERLKRRWIGIEIEEKYCEIAAKRIEQERKQLKLF